MNNPTTLGPTPGRTRTATILGVAFVLYLALSVLIWWNVWSTHPTGVATCGCDDPALFTWFLAWPAHAIAHGENPFYTTALNYPRGINLLSNTSVLAIGVPLAPVTWLFGPVATLNVALTLTPVLSAVSMFWLLRRWVSWAPAAFVGGLIFGFSPFVLTTSLSAHLMTEALAVLPLIVACLDELLIRQRRSAGTMGVVLALLLVVQFFVGTEVFTMVLLFMVIALVLLIAYGMVGHRSELGARAPHAARGLAVAALVALALLAYPLWFALDGPAHLSGLPWPSIPPGAGGVHIGDIWHLRLRRRSTVKYLSGYEGPLVSEYGYLGLGVLIGVGCGMLAWHRDRLLWFFGLLGLLAAILSLGLQRYVWTPWDILIHVAIIREILPRRITAIVMVCVAILLSIMIANLRKVSKAWTYKILNQIDANSGKNRSRAEICGALLTLCAFAVAVEPMGAVISMNTPITVGAISVDPWFMDVAPNLPSHQVLLTFPLPWVGDPLLWQAEDQFHFSLATGYGPDSVPERAGKERAGQTVLYEASNPLATLTAPISAKVKAVRFALKGWGVTTAVVPESSQVAPFWNRRVPTAWALAFFTLAIGRPPTFTHGAWVWSDVGTPAARRSIPLPAFAGCTTPQRTAAASRLAVPDCVMDASSPVT